MFNLKCLSKNEKFINGVKVSQPGNTAHLLSLSERLAAS